MPVVPGDVYCEMPLIHKLRNSTLSVAAALTLTPVVPLLARIEAITPPPPSIVIAWPMLMVPKPPGSITSISPPTAVREYAPGNVLHGAVRLQGLASSPRPETHVRVACACAADVIAQKNSPNPRTMKKSRFITLISLTGRPVGHMRSTGLAIAGGPIAVVLQSGS